MKKILHNNFGFTLIELLVAASLFVIVLTFGTNIYLSITNAQNQNYRMQKVLNESRFLLDMIAQDIQSNYIDYQTGYPDATLPEDELHLKMSDGSFITYKTTAEQLMRNNIPMSSAYIKITKLNFYIYPLEQNEINIPSVVIVWQAEEVVPANPAIINLQTMVSLRNY